MSMPVRRPSRARRFKPTDSPTTVMNHRRAWRRSETRFEVISRDASTRYQVDVLGGVPLCSCPAARHRRPCYHAAVVLRRLIREAA